jgi:amidase
MPGTVCLVPTFITKLNPEPGDGPTLAVKDLIDMAGLPTTAGSKAVADMAEPAAADAPCMAGARAARARIVGKANLVELAFGASGVNPWFGTPVNPLDPTLVPGGSSSGSAVAVATGEADIAYGSDTGGSIRVPSAFCGTVGLKTTHGRVPIEGVWPLALSLDTVGPMARDVAGVIEGMRLLEPGFSIDDAAAAATIGRVRTPTEEVDPRIGSAVDRALAEAGIEVVDVVIGEWTEVVAACVVILIAEAAQADGWLLDDPATAAKISPRTVERITRGREVSAEQYDAATVVRRRWVEQLDGIFQQVQVLATPTVAFFPPKLEDWADAEYTTFTNPANLAGVPALALPVPAPDSALPAGLQLIGPAHGEALLLATAARALA